MAIWDNNGTRVRRCARDSRSAEKVINRNTGSQQDSVGRQAGSEDKGARHTDLTTRIQNLGLTVEGESCPLTHTSNFKTRKERVVNLRPCWR